MEIALLLFFIFLGIILAIVDFAVEDKELKKFGTKSMFEDYMRHNLTVGQAGRTKIL